MKYLCAVMCFALLVGCTPSDTAYNIGTTIDPITGNVTATGTISGTFKDRYVSRSAMEPCAPVERAIDPCANEVRTIRALVNAPVRSYGYVYDSAAQFIAARALNPLAETVDLKTISRAVQVNRDTVRQNAKYDRIDQKIAQSRENHNGKVVQDATINRSMWSEFMGFFGHHRKPQPLPQAETVDITSAPIIAPDVVNKPPQTLPDASQPSTVLPPNGVIPAPKASTPLEDRVTALEANVAKILALLEKK